MKRIYLFSAVIFSLLVFSCSDEFEIDNASDGVSVEHTDFNKNDYEIGPVNPPDRCSIFDFDESYPLGVLGFDGGQTFPGECDEPCSEPSSDPSSDFALVQLELELNGSFPEKPECSGLNPDCFSDPVCMTYNIEDLAGDCNENAGNDRACSCWDAEILNCTYCALFDFIDGLVGKGTFVESIDLGTSFVGSGGNPAVLPIIEICTVGIVK